MSQSASSPSLCSGGSICLTTSGISFYVSVIVRNYSNFCLMSYLALYFVIFFGSGLSQEPYKSLCVLSVVTDVGSYMAGACV